MRRIRDAKHLRVLGRVTLACFLGTAVHADVAHTLPVASHVIVSVAADGALPFTYQWTKNGVPIPGGTSATLDFPSLQSADAGTYAVTVSNNLGSTTSDKAMLSVSTDMPGRLVNLSILTTVTPSDPQFTVGAVIAGAASVASKSLLVRAVGPSLAAFGVGDALADPTLEFYSGTRALATNDDWAGDPALSAAFVKVGAFAFSSRESSDAAVLSSGLPSGNYTVQISGRAGAGGTVLAELYDANPDDSATGANAARLANVSVLKSVAAGDVLTAGFVVSGFTSKQVLIRAVGPTLATNFGVPGTMANPELTLFSGGRVMMSNDDWGGEPSVVSAQSKIGAFTLPASSRDAALLALLPPGSYTAQARGLGGVGGTVLVEVYEVR